jgi:hypothetical protein
LETIPSPNLAHQRCYIESQKSSTHNLQQTKNNQTQKETTSNVLLASTTPYDIEFSSNWVVAN